MRDESRLTQGDAGVAVRVIGGRRAAIALTADLAIASVRSDTRGLASMRSLHATATFWGALAGVDATWFPLRRMPIALALAADVGGLKPVTANVAADGYTPFNDGFRIGVVRLGIAWRVDSAIR